MPIMILGIVPNMFWTVVLNIGMFAAFYIATVSFHELGHAVLLRKYTGKKIKVWFNRHAKSIQCGQPRDYDNLTDTQYNRIIFAGILAGTIPIILYSQVGLMQYYTTPFMFFMYIWGCRTDIKLLKESFKDMKE